MKSAGKRQIFGSNLRKSSFGDKCRELLYIISITRNHFCVNVKMTLILVSYIMTKDIDQE